MRVVAKQQILLLRNNGRGGAVDYWAWQANDRARRAAYQAIASYRSMGETDPTWAA
ncbi:MAG: hypothetical protein FWC56_05840 [Phycisphaerae bacterium]|nr:hypothetical protein [Phycisphaerae bacterium]